MFNINFIYLKTMDVIDIFLTFAAFLMSIRSYWVVNMIRIESNLEKLSFYEAQFLVIAQPLHMLLIRPFFKEKKDEKLRKKINWITFLIWACLLTGIIGSLTTS